VTDRSVLVHIGPFKTGTTAIQTVMHRNREVLDEHGIHYMGASLQPTAAVKAATGRTPEGPERDAGLKKWRRLVRKAAAHDKVLLSSEFLCEADDAAAASILADLGVDDCRVVVTLRPLANVMTSQWQQHVQTGAGHTLDEWLTSVLDEPSGAYGARFWQRHRHDVLAARWARVVGPERLTLLVVDPREPTQLTEAFLDMLDLPPGLLQPIHDGANRSMTWEEIEAIRQFNLLFRADNEAADAAGEARTVWPALDRLRTWVRLKRTTPGPSEHKIALPEEYAPRVGELAAEIVAGLQAPGYRVVGDLSALLDVRTGPRGPAQLPPEVTGRVIHAAWHRH
jgi:hypothetical protein